MSDGNEFHVGLRRRRGRHCLKRHGGRLVDDPLSDRQIRDYGDSDDSE